MPGSAGSVGTVDTPSTRVAGPPSQGSRIDALIQRYHLKRPGAEVPWELWLDTRRPLLRRVGEPQRAVAIDAGAARPASDPLLRAVLGRVPAKRPRAVVDATAGVGGDALALAAHGLEVTALERHAALAALWDATLAAWEGPARDAAPSGASRLTLTWGGAETVLPTLRPAPEVVYLDPMYPRGRSRAAKRGDAAVLRELLAPPDDVALHALLRAAQAAATRKVVVKRPPKAPPLLPGASGAVHGRTVRFDLYAGRAGEK